MTTAASTIEVQEVQYCNGCEEVLDEKDETLLPQYECSNCGNTFTREESPNGNHQCDCGKFAGLTGLLVCASCGDEPDETDVYDCPNCGEVHRICTA